jgi:hypothetical protein
VRYLPILLPFRSRTQDWLIWPEERTLIAHRLDGEGYRVVATIANPTVEQARARIPPFDSVEIDLAYILGD